MSAALRLAIVAVQWFTAAYITNEVTEAVAPQVTAKVGAINKPHEVGETTTERLPIMERLIPTAIMVAISAVTFFLIKLIISKISK